MDRRQHSSRRSQPSPPASPGDALTPQTLGPYELDELLGRGSTGEVYRAWDTRRSRTVALEVLSAELSADADFRARFEQVCRAVSELDEPHVVAVHEFGEIDGRLYLDVQLVDGRALSAVLAADGPLPAHLAVDVVAQVAAALDAAHAAGIVHGGVRPADVLLSGHRDRPECHLTHFGLAGTVGGAAGALPDRGGPGAAPGYVAPERRAGRPADHRADVYALAGLLSEALTGRPPGQREPLSPGEAGSAPGSLEAVVARGRAEDPDDRYASAGALAAAARAALPRTSDTVPVRAVPVAAPGGASGAGAARGAAAAGPARHRVAVPAARSRRPRGLAAALVAGAVALTAAGGVAVVRLASDDSDAATSTPVVLEPADDPGDAPFVPGRPGTTGAAGGSGAPASGAPEDGATDPTQDGATDPAQDGTADPAQDGTADPADDGGGDPAPGSAGAPQGAGDPGEGTAGPDAAPGSPVTGDRPGLYGGSGAEACDPAGMAAYLAENPDRGAAFAAVEGIPADGIADHLASLTPVVLRFDTAVTNHGFADGRAVPFQSVLQAGTAVLVDDAGVPQVRCICGNPLEPPAARPAPDYDGDPWPGSSPGEALVVARSAAPVPEFVLVDDATGEVEARPARTTGEADRVVDAALADRARGFGDRAPSPSGDGGSTSPVPSPSGSGDGADSDGAVPPGEAPGSGGPPGGDPGPPGAPAPPEGTDGGEPAGDAPADEPPAPAEQPPAPAEQPPSQAPPAEVPAEEAPADEGSTPEAPAEEAPAEEAPAEELPVEEAPVEEAPAEEVPTGDDPAEDGPADDDTADDDTADDDTADDDTAEVGPAGS